MISSDLKNAVTKEIVGFSLFLSTMSTNLLPAGHLRKLNPDIVILGAAVEEKSRV